MTTPLNIAIVGATGSVGEALVEILEERAFPVGNLHLLASIESAGKSLPFRGKNLRVREVESFDFKAVELVFFAAGEAVTRSFAARATAAGCAVIDLAGELQAPAVVPEANPRAFLAGRQAVSPCSPAIGLAVALAPLRAVLALRQVTVTACLAVSSLGREGVNELARQTAELLNARPLEPAFFDRQVAFNVLAQVGQPDTVGHLVLEKRIAQQLRETLELPLLDVSASCIQVPVFFGDSLVLSVRAEAPVDVAQVQAALSTAPGLELVEDAGDYPTPVGDAVGQDVVYAGRLRGGISDPCELKLWLTLDNVRKGAALNAVQIAELLIKDLS
ncbi:aspartate-semialdehyde dehydrogenase [Pseudomonas sp. NPDC007930]|uniref:aspartate-semialdehyde dehydrogenase n=1 Tax=Pseudomonas sp. NPDC007930 TaxID=3364417 RepID=UPI0036EDB2BD